MATKLEMLQEASDRGLLSPEKQAAFDEYMLRQNAQPVEETDLDGYIPDENSPSIALMRGATMDLSDEATGGIAAVYMKMHDMVTGGLGKSEITGEEPAGFRKNYETARDQVRADQEAYAKKWPKTNVALQVGGTVLTGGYGAAKVLGTQLAKQAPKIALPAVAAVEGATYGFGEGEGSEESLKQAGIQGLTSAVVAPVLDKIIGHTIKAINRRKAKTKYASETKNLDDLYKESQEFYNLAEKSGVKIRVGAWAKFRKDIIKKLKDIGVDISAKPPTPTERGVSGSIKRMMNNKEPTYKDLAAMKELLKSAKRSSDPSISDAAYDVSNLIDDFVENLKPGQVSAGDLTDLADNVSKARSYWSRMKQGKTLANAKEKAELSRTATKDADLDEAINATNRSIVNPENARKRRGMTSETISGLKDMILGTPGKNLARFGAGMDPGSATARGISPAMGGGVLAIGGYAAAGPAGLLAGLIPLVPPLLGRAFKGIANNITRKEYKVIEDAVLNKDIDTVEEIVKKLYSKYQTNVSGISAALAAEQSGNMSELLPSTLTDMISP